MWFFDTKMESIQDFYSGKSIFMTGATGFMGKVLVEKLLRSCPKISAIYILVRPKKGKSGQERWDKLTEQQVFDRLKKEQPENLKKVKVIEGKINLPLFGLEEAQYEELKRNVTVIFHAAASVRFDDPIKAALEMNVLATQKVLEFALEANKIDAFLHVSTSYSNTHLKLVEEKIYPPFQDWRKVVRIAQEIDENELALLTKTLIHPFANTYIFTKHLAEQVVNEYKTRLPIAVIRPSIVVASWKEPIPGWLDNLNGPFALIAAVSKGILRVALGRRETKADYIPVDVSVKSMIVAAWKKAIEKQKDKKYEIDVYNSSSIDVSITIGTMIDIGVNYMKEKPFTKAIWTPSIQMTRNPLSFRLQYFFKHLIPSLFFDTLLRVQGQKPRLYDTHKKIMSAMFILDKFMTEEWTFVNDKFLSLNDEIPAESKQDFDYSFNDIDTTQFIRNSCDKFNEFVLRENDSPESIIKHNRRIYLLDKALQTVAAVGTIYASYCYLS